MSICTCGRPDHEPRLVVLTGGPGAGKTAVLEVARRELCQHVAVLPESASILWRGGFPRTTSDSGRRAAQRAIVHVQIELQRHAVETDRPALVLCDRGTLDGLAYWPGTRDEYLSDLDTTYARELARYSTVIQLCPPSRAHGYQMSDIRPETAEQAAEINERISDAWAGHPRHLIVESNADFLIKLRHVVELLRGEVPACCRDRRGA